MFSSKTFTILKLVLHGHAGWQYSRKRTISTSFHNHNADKSTDRPRPINQSNRRPLWVFSPTIKCLLQRSEFCFPGALHTQSHVRPIAKYKAYRTHARKFQVVMQFAREKWTPLSLTPIQLHYRFPRKHLPPRLVPPPADVSRPRDTLFRILDAIPRIFPQEKKRRMPKKIDVRVRTRNEQNLCRGCNLIRC